MDRAKNNYPLSLSISFLFSLSLINYLDRVTLSVAGKAIAGEFGLSPVQLGYFFSSFLWSYVLCVVPCGILADRVGPRIVILGGIVLWSLATIGTGLATGFVAILATRIVMGVGEATSYPGAIRLIRESVPAADRGFATATFNSGAYAGPAFGAVLIGWLISVAGWRLAFVIAGLIGLGWAALWLLFLKLTGQSLRSRPIPAVSASANPSGIGRLLRSRSLWGTALTQGCSIYTLYFLLTWLPTYLQSTTGLNIAQAGIASAVPYIGAVLLNILFGRLSDRFGRSGHPASGNRRAMIGIMMVLSSVLLFTPMISDLRGLTLLFAVSLTGISSAGSLNMTLASDLLVRPDDAATVNALVVLGGNVFGILAPIVTGYIVSATGGYDAAFIVAGVLALCGALASQTMTRSPIGTAIAGDLP
jgi:MFS family permease